VSQKSFDLLQFETRLLAPGAHGVAKAVLAVVGKTKGQGNRLDVRLEQRHRPERSVPGHSSKCTAKGACAGDDCYCLADTTLVIV
jgi:hypothetical protein